MAARWKMVEVHEQSPTQEGRTGRGSVLSYSEAETEGEAIRKVCSRLVKCANLVGLNPTIAPTARQSLSSETRTFHRECSEVGLAQKVC